MKEGAEGNASGTTPPPCSGCSGPCDHHGTTRGLVKLLEPSTETPRSDSSASADPALNSLQQSLTLIKGPSDEERFGGLLLLAKLLNTKSLPEQTVLDVRRQLLEAINPQFLYRLLRTATPGEPSSFQVVAVTIIAYLCQDHTLLPQCRRLLPAVLAVFDLAQEPRLLEDCTIIILAVASCLRMQGLPIASHPELPQSISSALNHLSINVVRIRLRALAPSPAPLSQTLPDPESPPQEMPGDPLARFYDMAMMAFDNVGTHPGVLASISDEALVQLSLLLEAETTAFKFRLLRVVALILGSRRQVVNRSPLPVTFGQHLRSALVQLLHGAVREDKRDWALRVLVDMVELAGEAWALEPAVTPTLPYQPTVLPRGTSAAFFVHILTTEVRVGLEEALAIWEVPREEPSLEAVREKRLERIHRVVLVCLGAVESVLQFLCGIHHDTDDEQGMAEGDETMHASESENEEEEGHWDNLPAPILLRMRDSFHSIIAVIVRFIREGGALLWNEHESLPEAEAQTTLLPLMRASLRLLGVYLAEDELSLPSSTVLEVLAAAMRLARQEQDGAKECGGSSSSSGGPSQENEDEMTPYLFPLMSKVLSGGEITEIKELVGLGAHLLLCRYIVRHHMTQSHPGRMWEALLNLYELITQGAQLPCEDHATLLAEHPAVLDLLPVLPPSAREAVSRRHKDSFRLAHYLTWFLLRMLKLFPLDQVRNRLPRTGEAYQSLVQALDHLQRDSSDVRMSEEEKQELVLLREEIRQGLHDCEEFFR